ncbi:ferric reductase like transmembrane component-domain-containing protein [Boeremia exigua]|uniref:ferric reductase like transmembrane component-domain-containing protein n=1 Tax=Boeremia exigua TaxID=749465 RepID=UPI001E8E6FA8|nr:ferric reductase like transmembrane component-domain-containing protein [Boeremia exigua]KAH6633157.1 ferric reductase like transmembrane component-domain-containing protein [Boeremia exigua]
MDIFRRHEGHHEVESKSYWALGYSFEPLSDEQKHQRRENLDYYGFAAQWSVLVVFALFQMSFGIRWIVTKGMRYEQPKSPSFNKGRENTLGWLKGLHSRYARVMWWMQKDVVSRWDWGTRGEWIGGTLWTAWLLYLCFVNTSPDYLHLTKRFGQIGASQLPLHYLLAMRTPYSPVQWITRLSHEQLKAAHQVLGRIVYLLFLLHAVFYLVFFGMSNLLAKRLQDRDVIFGLIALALFTAISTTALGFVRRRNYRVFYLSHVAIANLLVVPLFLHVSHLRIYVYQTVLILALHTLSRTLRLKSYQGTLRLLPGTSLVQIRIPLPDAHPALAWPPGQHVYLTRPHGASKPPGFAAQCAQSLHANPFTIASLPGLDRELLLVARARAGATRELAALAQRLAKGGAGVSMLPTAGGDIPLLALALEGPYGASARLPDLTEYDSVLLVAGGVGATFVLPVWRALAEFHDATPGAARVRCVWAVQTLADALWAFPETAGSGVDARRDDAVRGGLLARPAEVEVYVTRGAGAGAAVGAEPIFALDDDDTEGFEMQESAQLLGAQEQPNTTRRGMVVTHGRPEMRAVVDEVFSRGTRTAVLCCGPKRLTADLKACVEVYVRKGCEVFWYDEAFGW